MQYAAHGDTLVIRLDPQEEIVEQLVAVARKESVVLAEVRGLGAVGELTTGVFDPVSREYHANTFAGTYEIVSLTGTITRRDGEPYLHAHLAAGDAQGQVVGGHLNRAVVSATAEILMRVLPGEIGRRFDEAIGLNLLDL